MKSKFLFIFLLIIMGATPMSAYSVGLDEASVPAPIFVGVTPAANPVGSFIYEYNTTVTITYTAERNVVDGVVLLGEGNNLTGDYETSLSFTEGDSEKSKTTWTLNLTILEYTRFYAYAWSNTLDNGTLEEFDTFDSINYHQIWVNGEDRYPIFVDVIDAEEITDNIEFYVPLDRNVTIRYQLRDPYNNGSVTLSFADNETSVYDDEPISRRVDMVAVEHNADLNRTFFEYNHTISQRLEFFTAFSENSWERQVTNPDNGVVHRITTGFSFQADFDLDFDEYTELDPIEMNLTSYNESIDDAFFLRYRVFENESSDVIIANWTEIDFGTNDSYTIITDPDTDYNSTAHVYYATVPKQDVGRLVQVQTFVRFKTGSYNETVPIDVVIKDSRPTIDLLSSNSTYTNDDRARIAFEFSNVRGSVLNATMVTNITSYDVKGQTNENITFSDGDTVVEGMHIANLTVFNTLISSRSVIIVVYVDTTLPVATFDSENPTKTDDDGYITLMFDLSDGVNGTGVKEATLDWGDGLVQNVTSLSMVNHQYRKGGEYRLNLTLYDMAGNANFTLFEVNATVPELITTPTRDSPLPYLPMYLAIFSMVLVIYKKRK